VQNIVAGADPATLAAAAEDRAPYLQSRGLNADVVLEPAIRAKLPGPDKLTADRDNLGKALAIHGQNARSLHANYIKGTLPSPAVSAAAYDVDAS
jgi:hypothetical protein